MRLVEVPMPTCPKCKSEQPNDAQFCSQCSEPLTERGKKLAKASPWAIIFTAAFLAFAGYFVLHVVNLIEKDSANTNKRPTVIAPRVPQPHSVPVVNSATTVNASSYSWYTLTVPPNVSAVTVSGHFTATGGAGNDVEVYILDEDAFANFKNGHPATTYYNSGKVTTASIQASLPVKDTFYILLDNRFSLITPKAVQMNVTLNYLQ
jgi:hypothetical protein